MYRVKEGIIGCAIGDALGVPSKGISREYLLEHPVLKMNPSVKKGIPKGAWSESTSLMLATTDAIIKRDINYNYIAENCVSWFTSAKYCSVGEAFGIGNTTLNALLKFSKRENEAYDCGLTEFNDNGNGALKMMLPLAFYFTAKKSGDKEIYNVVKLVCSITHKHQLSICACYIYINYIKFLLNGNNKYGALKLLKTIDYSMFSNKILAFYSPILFGNISELDIDEISSSSFVVDTLTAVLWCFIQSNSFKDCVVAGANIGDDTSSVGALVGALAGIYYGTNKVPSSWMEDLRKKDYLISISEEYEKYLRNLSYK